MPTIRDSRAPNVRKDGSVSLHEQAIRDLIDSDPAIHRNGFKRAIRSLWTDLLAQYPEMEDVPEILFIPDAYCIDHEKQEIVIYEVAITNPINDHKMHDLAMFWFDWDCEGDHDWLPRLVIVDKFGNRTNVNLCEMYHTVVLAKHRPSAANRV